MRYVATNSRSWIANEQPPSSGRISSTVSSVNPVVASDVSSEQVAIRWSPVPGATYYHVEVRRSGFLRDYITADTFIFISGLQPNTSYNINVAPRNERDFCAGYRTAVITTGGPLKAIARVKRMGCTIGARVEISAWNGTPVYVYRWRGKTNWQVDSVFCGVESGWQVFVVRDANGDSVLVPVYVHPDSTGSIISGMEKNHEHEELCTVNMLYRDASWFVESNCQISRVDLYTIDGRLISSTTPIKPDNQLSITIPSPESESLLIARITFAGGEIKSVKFTTNRPNR